MNRDEGFAFLLDAMVVGPTAAIEAQEARGQREIVASETIPNRMFHGSTEAHFIAMGFTLGEKVDDLFRKCTLPAGWSKQPTDHSMWSHIVDDKGRVRCRIFYKAAFYDRSAHISIDPRFSVSCRYVGDGPFPRPEVGQVLDAGNVIHETPESTDNGYGDARAWLKEKYPNHEDLTAYWDA